MANQYSIYRLNKLVKWIKMKKCNFFKNEFWNDKVKGDYRINNCIL